MGTETDKPQGSAAEDAPQVITGTGTFRIPGPSEKKG